MNFLGANWRTTLSGIGSALTSLLTVLAALPYELGDAATIFPPEWKAKIAVAGAVATVILRSINSMAAKDAVISGNGTLDDPLRKPSDDGQRSRTLPLLLIFLLPLCLFTGCAGGMAVTGRLSYQTERGSTLSIGSDGKNVILEGDLSGLRK